MTTKHPWFKFYPQDWRGDAKLRRCSRAARSLWLDMLGLMHEADPYGHLVMDGKALSATDLARIFGDNSRTIRALLEELKEANVFSTTPDGTLYSRRMVRDAQTAQRRAAGGVRSLENPNVPRPKDTSKDTSEGIHDGGPHMPEARSQNTRTTAKATPVPRRAARAVGAEKPDRPSGFDVLPKEHVDRAYARWVRDLGACNYARLRKALLPIYAEPSANHPTPEELENAVGAFLDGRDADNPAFTSKWNVEKFANELTTWVEFGRMSYVTEWGIPTRRGILTGLFSAA